MNETQKPDEYTDEVEVYLDALRESGITNMFASPEYLVQEYGFTEKVARQCFLYWSQNFGKYNRLHRD